MLISDKIQSEELHDTVIQPEADWASKIECEIRGHMGGGELGTNRGEGCRWMGDPIVSYRLLCSQRPSVACSLPRFNPWLPIEACPPAGSAHCRRRRWGSLAAIHRLGLGLSLLSLWNWHHGPTLLVVAESARPTHWAHTSERRAPSVRVHHTSTSQATAAATKDSRPLLVDSTAVGGLRPAVSGGPR